MIEEHKTPVVDSDSSEGDGVEQEEFAEGDCDSDFEDTLGNNRRLKRRKREEVAKREANRIIGGQFLPSSSKNLYACVSCKLVLNRDKWRKLEQCPNCPQSSGLKDTTANFSNLIGSIYPKASWVA